MLFGHSFHSPFFCKSTGTRTRSLTTTSTCVPFKHNLTIKGVALLLPGAKDSQLNDEQRYDNRERTCSCRSLTMKVMNE